MYTYVYLYKSISKKDYTTGSYNFIMRKKIVNFEIIKYAVNHTDYNTILQLSFNINFNVYKIKILCRLCKNTQENVKRECTFISVIVINTIIYHQHYQ